MSTNKLIILIQLVLIVIICEYIYLKKNNVLGTKISVSSVSDSSIEKIEFNNLKYYYDLKPNSTATWSPSFLDKPVTNYHNADGLNDTQNYSPQKDSKSFRIITLGDSFTYGQNVSTDQNWTEVLEKKLNAKKICQNIDKFEIINLGVDGYDPTYEVARYKKTGQKYNPDLIIWMLIDVNRLNEEKAPYINKCLAENIKTSKECWIDSIQYVLDANGKENIIKKQTSFIKDLQQTYTNHIFFVDYYNTHSAITKNISNSTTFSKMLTSDYLYKDNSGVKIHFPDSHPTPLGHQLIANIIFDQLFITNQIPCEPLVQK